MSTGRAAPAAKAAATASIGLADAGRAVIASAKIRLKAS
jgi:hypothetical protein